MFSRDGRAIGSGMFSKLSNGEDFSILSDIRDRPRRRVGTATMAEMDVRNRNMNGVSIMRIIDSLVKEFMNVEKKSAGVIDDVFSEC